MACLVHCRFVVLARSSGGDEITPISATTAERFHTNVPWALARGMVGSGQVAARACHVAPALVMSPTVEKPLVGRSNDEDHDDVP
jgi:hypothetical protein